MKLVLIDAYIFRNCSIRRLRLGTDRGNEALGQHSEVEKNAVDDHSSARIEHRLEILERDGTFYEECEESNLMACRPQCYR